MGEVNPDAVAAQLSWAQFVEWQAFYVLDGMLQKEMAQGKSAPEALQVVEAMIDLHRS